jgi:5,10-methylenetetrahydrofolate reductase
MDLKLTQINLIDNMINKLQNDTFISLEVTPSRGGNFNKVLANIEDIQIDSIIDAFVTTDNPLAKLKYSSLLASIRLQDIFNKPSIVTMSMRDRNLLALQADLLGANDFDIRAFLTLTGDSVKHGDHPKAKAVMQGNSLLLLDIIKKLNNQTDFMDKKLISPTKTIYPFSTIHSFSKDFNHIKKQLQKKISHYPSAIITQPVYDNEHSKILLDIFDEVVSSFDDARADTKLIFGMFPIVKHKTASFLDKKVPGLYIPTYWLEKLEQASHISSEEEYKVGFDLSFEVMKKTYSLNPRLHIMSANDFSIAHKLITMVRR